MMSRSCRPSSSLPCSQTSRMTSAGRRWRTASIASVLSWARRAVWPSSSRMPAISVQMSRSSSTMRMSWAMTLQTVRDGLSGSLCGCRMRSSRRDFLRVTPEYQTDARTATLAVIKPAITAVIFHDLLDDREAEAGALAAGRHVRLGEPLAPLLRQAFAVVLDDNAHGGIVVAQGERDFSRWQRLAWQSFPALDRLGRVLEDVGQHLRDLAAVADQRHRMLRPGRDVADLRIAVALQEQRLLAEFLGILRLHRRARHAGERRELVDHAADVADLADDGVGADREGLRILLDLLEVTALQPLGGELDRRQRILDLVGDAPRHVAPRRHALSRHQVGYVVEGNHGARVGGGADADKQDAAGAALQDLDLALGDAVGPLRRLRHERRQFRHYADQRPAEHAVLGQRQEFERRAVAARDRT